MGIYKLNKFLHSYLQTIQQNFSNLPCKIYIDGNQFLYLNNNNNDSDDNKKMEIACNLIYSCLIKCSFLNIQEIILFFDGNQRSVQKVKRSSIPSIDKNDFINFLQEKQPNFQMCPIQIHQSVGETDIEWFNVNDFELPTYYITRDSDLFHLGYNTKNCIFFDVHRSRNLFYNLEQLKIKNLTRLSFTLLVLLAGSDYTPTIFSTSMICQILNENEKLDNYVYPIDYDEVTADATTTSTQNADATTTNITITTIEKTIYAFLQLIKNNTKYRKARKKKSEFNNFEKYSILLNNVLHYYYYYNSKYIANIIEIGNGYNYLEYIINKFDKL